MNRTSCRCLCRLSVVALAISAALMLSCSIASAANDPAGGQESNRVDAGKLATGRAPTGIYFDDSQPDLIVIGNTDFYEIGFRKSNGGIAYIIDKATGGSVTQGSRYGCLWGSVFGDDDPFFIGGCSFDAGSPDRFNYAWSPATQSLQFTYTPVSYGGLLVPAQVTIQPSAGHGLAMQLQLENGRSEVMDWVLFPCDTVFVEAEIREALLPILPGIVLTPQFYAENRSFTTRYPGYPGVFSDFVWLATEHGRLAIYSQQGGGSIRPLDLGFIHDEEYLPDSTFYYHTFAAHVANDEAFTTPWIHIRVGEDAMQAIQAYRTDNGIDDYRSLQQKLDTRYEQFAAAPVYKADTAQLSMPFNTYDAILARLPSPGILHPVGFQPGEHDNNYPDFLPPAPAWGTTADMAAMFRRAQARGLLVMPYTNPTWWNDESPTLSTLPSPLTMRDVAVLDEAGAPVYEWYGPNGGYVMSPYPAFVRNRLDRMVAEMTTDVPSDLLFEDQIGARPWLFDYNASSPSPLSYMDGWLAHTRTYSDTLLMTELGFDRLAETEIGFNGSIRLPEELGYTPSWLGTGTWRPFPFATALARDKTFFYQHDLAPETFTTNKEILRWNLAMGYMLSYDLVKTTYGGGPDSQWLDVVGAFQKWALAAYADQRITGYSNVASTPLTQTDFETCRVYANWSPSQGYTVGAHAVVPDGAMVTCDAGAIVAGVFNGYNGINLSAGDHYLIESRGAWGTIVRQPMGADTDLTLAPLPKGGAGGPSVAYAIDASGNVVGSVPVSPSATGLTFRYRSSLNGKPVAAYRLRNPPAIYLPLVER